MPLVREHDSMMLLKRMIISDSKAKVYAIWSKAPLKDNPCFVWNMCCARILLNEFYFHKQMHMLHPFCLN